MTEETEPFVALALLAEGALVVVSETTTPFASVTVVVTEPSGLVTVLVVSELLLLPPALPPPPAPLLSLAPPLVLDEVEALVAEFSVLRAALMPLLAEMLIDRVRDEGAFILRTTMLRSG